MWLAKTITQSQSVICVPHRNAMGCVLRWPYRELKPKTRDPKPLANNQPYLRYAFENELGEKNNPTESERRQQRRWLNLRGSRLKLWEHHSRPKGYCSMRPKI